MGLFRDWFGDEFEDSWNKIWSGDDPLGDGHDFLADQIWDPILDLMGISDADRKQIISAGSSIPVIGDIWRMADQYQYNQDYMKNTGLTWNDVKYPTMVNSGGTNIYNVARQGTNFVSDNIKKLYKRH